MTEEIILVKFSWIINKDGLKLMTFFYLRHPQSDENADLLTKIYTKLGDAAMQDGNYQDALRFYDEIKTMQALYNQAQVKFMLKIFWQAFYLFYCIFLKQNGKPHSDWWLQQNTDIQPSEQRNFA